MTLGQLQSVRRLVKPTLVYWHGSGCGYWPLEGGAGCPSDHSDDIPIYDYRGRKGRKRRMWICLESADAVGYLNRQDFLEHDVETCFA